LKLLYDENLLTFDAQQLSWQWNLTEIEAQDITASGGVAAASVTEIAR